MKILQSVQKIYAKLGLCAPTFSPNLRNVLTLFILSQVSISSIVYLLLEANTFMEYAESFYAASTTFITWLNFTIVLIDTENLFTLFQDLENAISRRNTSNDVKSDENNTIFFWF